MFPNDQNAKRRRLCSNHFLVAAGQVATVRLPSGDIRCATVHRVYGTEAAVDVIADDSPEKTLVRVPFSEVCADTSIERYITPRYPRAKYQNSTDATTERGLHIGQRKLLLSEIEFLTHYLRDYPSSIGENNSLFVIYAGAANGRHIPFLLRLFREARFYLADPVPFHDEVVEEHRLNPNQLTCLLNGYFSDEIAERLRSDHATDPILFISDIRSYDSASCSRKDCTQNIMRDNNMQRSWVKILRPKRSMLKFHPPYAEDAEAPRQIPYFPGRCYFGVWAPRSSTEVRLVTNEDQIEQEFEYDIEEFEEQLHHFNITDRYAQDCSAEYLILFEYTRLRQPTLSMEKTHAAVAKLSKEISEALGHIGFKPLENGFSEEDARHYWKRRRSD
eukprot:TRINITY_DN98575_c0_g1_i1.p1 TRINITY_DN98575_c0_g1~~TRINITY_DN98575_c0_g1_i1.p1  ORF type:complete len:397 (+),score=41.14 TRINITY_DN98575_c0_g1_i1:26-1192(+)